MAFFFFCFLFFFYRSISETYTLFEVCQWTCHRPHIINPLSRKVWSSSPFFGACECWLNGFPFELLIFLILQTLNSAKTQALYIIIIIIFFFNPYFFILSISPHSASSNLWTLACLSPEPLLFRSLPIMSDIFIVYSHMRTPVLPNRAW